MPKTITIADDCVALELDEAKLEILNRALTGFARSLLAARDMGILSHETFCDEADAARAVQYMVWAEAEKFEVAKRHLREEPNNG